MTLHSFTRLMRTLTCGLLIGGAAVLSAQQMASNHPAQPAPMRQTASSPAVSPNAYRIGPDDVLAISVWKEPEVSRVLPVRPDGKIDLPLVGEVQASGLTAQQLQQQLTGKLKNYISDPSVTVIVQQVRSRQFNVLGKVMRPGAFALARPMTVLDGLAVASGFQDFANKNKIYVLRDENGRMVRLPFNYGQVIKGKRPQENVYLQPGDTIVVP